MGFVAGRDFLEKVPSPHPSPKTLGIDRKIYCIEIVTTYAFFQPLYNHNKQSTPLTMRGGWSG